MTIMKVCFLMLLLIGASAHAAFVATSQSDKRGWNGIVPLFSTRADVMRLLGTPEGDCKCRYRTQTETVTFDYAEAPCKGPNGWDVPRDTVLQIRITPISPKTLSELGLDETQYVRSGELDTSTIHLTDLRQGLRYSIQDNHVISISYLPIPEDNSHRCTGYPPYNGGISDYHPYDTFPVGSNERTYAHLDGFAHYFSNHSAFTAYVIAYAGKSSKQADGKRTAELVRDYLVCKRAIPSNKVVTIDGGCRENAEIELYLLPGGMPPPSPRPTLPRC